MKGHASMDPVAALASAADGVTAVVALHNAAWLATQRVRGAEASGRRVGAATLALLNAGIAVEAAYAMALFAAHRLGAPTDGFFAPANWLAARLALLCGVLALGALIARRYAR